MRPIIFVLMRRFLPLLLLFAVIAPVEAAQGEGSARPAVSGETAGYYFLLARHYENTGRASEAVAAYQKALELEPKSAEIRAQLAALYARENKAVEAVDAAEEALKYDPANQEANRILGTIYSILSEQKARLRPGDDPAQYLPKAIAALERARGTAGTDLGTEFALGRLYLRAGRTEDAIPPLRRVFEGQPDYSEGGMLLSSALEATGKIAEATDTVQTVIRENPTFFRGHVRLIELLEGQRRWKEAAVAYAAAQTLNPRADLAAGRGAALLNSGDIPGAQALLTDAIAKRPAPDAALLYLLAESQRRAGDLAAATATTQKLRAAFPDDTRGLIMQAQLDLAQGRRDAALGTFADLVKRMPDERTFGYQYAQLLEEAGRIAEAEGVLRAMIERDPKDANALNSLGYMFADRGERLDEAVELLQRALKIEPGNASYLDSLGWAYFKGAKLDLADAPLTAAADQQPANSVIQDHLGDLRFRQQRFADAVTAWERALAGDGEGIDRAAIEKKLRDARARLKK
jgi:tetratricopeptide (TPR) repeat protein